ncbi:MAG: di-trans,poly-cis-decaprenylcistransferase [Candidatus Margulisbacteria bacterium]|jgi:undecaprenyl diphosphate synthase|nr:di-trans,poly-cis-decaprenylcistransferase [Candidatus Margulisiibacteriota bacterium]
MENRDTLFTTYGIDKGALPHHIAIIMDGNGRWAKQRFLPRNLGHRQGQKQLKATLKDCVTLGIKVLSVYVFSTENWRRPEDEVSFLLSFLKASIQDEINELNNEGVRLRFLGDLTQFDNELMELIQSSESLTSTNDVIQLNVMLNYGARRELINAMKSMVQGGVDMANVDEDAMAHHLYTTGIPDPDILIRTGGDIRISNFMLWQCAYSELFFLDTFWPDFNMQALCEVVAAFQKRDRRFGGLSE